MPDTLLLVDAYSLIYRAFYAIRSLNGPRGQPVNAIFGFAKMLHKLVADHSPTHVAVVFDLGAPRQRLDLLPTYKANRPPTPPDLEAQLPDIRTWLDGERLPVVEQEGEEADDLIATLATAAACDRARVLIATSDKDLMQLVAHNVLIIRADASLCDADDVRARYGVAPSQIADLLTLVGDSVDNIPGVPGIGEKTAADLLARFGTLDDLLRRLDEVQKPKLRETLTRYRDQLLRNRPLLRLRTDIALPAAWQSLRPGPMDKARLAALYRECGFKSLLKQLEPPAPSTGDLFANY